MDLTALSKQELVDMYLESSIQKEELEAKQVELRHEILSRLKLKSELWGEHIVTRIKKGRLSIPTKKAEKDEIMNKLRDLSLVKTVEQVDNQKAEVLLEKGIKLPCEFVYSEYPLITERSEEE